MAGSHGKTVVLRCDSPQSWRRAVGGPLRRARVVAGRLLSSSHRLSLAQCGGRAPLRYRLTVYARIRPIGQLLAKLLEALLDESADVHSRADVRGADCPRASALTSLSCTLLATGSQSDELMQAWLTFDLCFRFAVLAGASQASQADEFELSEAIDLLTSRAEEFGFLETIVLLAIFVQRFSDNRGQSGELMRALPTYDLYFCFAFSADASQNLQAVDFGLLEVYLTEFVQLISCRGSDAAG